MPPIRNNTRSRAWCFTINNYDPADLTRVTSLLSDAAYGIYGKEVGDSGTPHLQGYVYFHSAKSFRAMRQVLAPHHVEKAGGSPLQNQQYCQKEGDYQEFGELPHQGKRSDLISFREAIASAPSPPSTDQLLTQHTKIFATHPRFMRQVIDHYHPPKVLDGNLSNMWIYGPASTGKSSYFYQEAKTQSLEIYVKNANKWFDGYADQPIVLIDDLPRDFSHLAYYLKIWADRYPFRGEIKGASRTMRPLRIWITSNHPPWECDALSGTDLDAILSRFRVYSKSGISTELVEDTRGPEKK